MQPYFLPYIGYFQLISSVDKFVSYSIVDYRKSSWINRNRVINYSNQNVSYIGYPIRKFRSGTIISNVQINEFSDWRTGARKFIFHNYKRSPFFDEIFHVYESILENSSEYVAELNNHAIKSICSFLDIKTVIEENNKPYEEIEEKLKSDIESGLPPMTARIAGICAYEEASHYINPIGGQGLYKPEDFQKFGVDLSFLKVNDLNYDQHLDVFHPNLSILDVLFHNGREKVKSMLSEFELIT
ncbi:MAG: WbqC family protein [Cytophagales bacterium]|nr:WbqC family protein [Cytophagales bacterium]